MPSLRYDFWVCRTVENTHEYAAHITRRDLDWNIMGGGHVLIWHDSILQTDIRLDRLESMAWRADNQTLVTATEDTSCIGQAWDAVTGEQILLSKQLFEWRQNKCSLPVVRSDGQAVVTRYLARMEGQFKTNGVVKLDHRIRLYNLRTGEVQADYDLTEITRMRQQ